jgi:hypothetical protein
MKIQIQLDVPEDITVLDLEALVQEFRYLARLRGWKMLLALPGLRRCTKKAPDVVQAALPPSLPG